jgi:multicomponent Na+:H+ antiporter subunit E
MIYYLKEFIAANVFIIFDMLTPGSRATPAIVKLPLKSKSDLEITMLSCLISLTPGTLALAIASHPPTLYVHGIYAPESEEFRAKLSDFEEHMLRGMRLPENLPSQGETS